MTLQGLVSQKLLKVLLKMQERQRQRRDRSPP